MKKFIGSIFIFITISSCSDFQSEEIVNSHEDDLGWRPFEKNIFEDAKKSDKLILLHIGANWCHWCHVMEDSTYSDKKVQSILSENFILSKEDQDSRADLFSKYRDFGWPAIIVFDADGNEIQKLKGYQEKTKFIKTLQELIANPIPNGESSKTQSDSKDTSITLTNPQLLSKFNQLLDHEKGSLKTTKKSLNNATIFLAMEYYLSNDSLKSWLNLSINNSYLLLDPVWGGVYQYSTHNNWNNQHFEKILRVQAQYIEVYTHYGELFNDTLAIKNAERIYEYCNRFLSENAPLFDNSQDADYKKGVESSNYYSLPESERLALGTPAVNHAQFLKENAMMASALVKLWAATDNKKYLVRSEKILSKLLNNYKGNNGLYCRIANDTSIYSLDDNVALLDALILAYQVSGEEKYINQANNLATAILKNFTDENGTLFSVCGDLIVTPSVVTTSNYNALFSIARVGRILNDDNYITEAGNILKQIYQPAFQNSAHLIPNLLKSSKIINEEPFHAVWLYDERGTQKEFEFVRKIIMHPKADNIIIERVNLKNLDSNQQLLYGSSEPGTLFMCTSTFCSSPIVTIEGLDQFLQSL